jgi:Leucine Rich repeat
MVMGEDTGFDPTRLQSYRRRFHAALAQVGRLRRLEELELSTSEVTDVGLKHLMGLTTLKKLDLGSTQVTDAGAQELQRALPNLEIVR